MLTLGTLIIDSNFTRSASSSALVEHGVRISGHEGVRISGHEGVRISGHSGVRISAHEGVRISGRRSGVRISGSRRGVRISSRSTPTGKRARAAQAADSPR